MTAVRPYIDEVTAVAPECRHERIHEHRGRLFECYLFIPDRYARSVPNRVLVFDHYRAHHPPQYEQRTSNE